MQLVRMVNIIGRDEGMRMSLNKHKMNDRDCIIACVVHQIMTHPMFDKYFVSAAYSLPRL